MNLTRSQIYSILAFLSLLLILAAFRTKPKDLLEREKNRSLNLQSTNANILIQEAVPDLRETYKTRIQILEAQLSSANEEQAAQLYKDLSSVWFESGNPSIAGHYAEEVATLEETAEAWGLAATTYALCINRSEKEKEKEFCLAKSLNAIENAITLAPEEIDYQINRGVILAENPPPDNPMKGVLLLLDLNKKYPKNVSVINNIAKFALQTNQLERAEQRLLGALEIEPNNKITNCLLTEVYLAMGQKDKSLVFQEKCAEQE